MDETKLAELRAAAERVDEIRERVRTEYRTIPQPDFRVMQADLKTLLGELNITSGFWKNAEDELDEIRNCDKCDLCEDHHGEQL